jgi:translocation and assembly module TamB
MKIEAFGGNLRVRNLRLDALFTPYSTSSADIDFTGIDLRLVTATFAFGEINGTADGYIRELRLFGAVPSHFEASIETRSQGRRNISVKALRNLTTISQGGLSAVLSRGIYRFIDFYRYRKIGLHCTLRNDVFLLRGTARGGDDRYLVDGGLFPPKINIIAPENAISFKEMLNRLQRIDRTGSAGEG